MFTLTYRQLVYEPFRTLLTGAAVACALTVILLLEGFQSALYIQLSRVLWLEDGVLRDRKSEQHSCIIDPVCGMRVDECTATISAEYKGNKFVFFSSRCLERFNANPVKYVGAQHPSRNSVV